MTSATDGKYTAVTAQLLYLNNLVYEYES